MGRSRTLSGTPRSRSCGFSMVELAISLSILLILTGIAIPSLVRSMRTYQLNDAAGRLSDMLKFTRFEAVRQNKPVRFVEQQAGSDWIVGTDSNPSGPLNSADKQFVITGFATLLSSGGSPGPPDASPIMTALGVTSLTTLSGSSGWVTFDARGAVRVGGGPSSSVDVFYLGSPNAPEFGYRAVVLLPSGATQVWTAPAGGPWRRIS